MTDGNNPAGMRLRPCAFCGYDSPTLYKRKKTLTDKFPIGFSNRVPDRFYVGCPLCQSLGPKSDLSLFDAIRLWNVRAAPPVVVDPAVVTYRVPNVIPFRRRQGFGSDDDDQPA